MDAPENSQPTKPPPPQEFPERIFCPQCRRPYRVEQLRTRVNTLLTETLLACPRCRRRLRRMKMKDWYDHYVQGQKPEPVRDEDILVKLRRRH